MGDRSHKTCKLNLKNQKKKKKKEEGNWGNGKRRLSVGALLMATIAHCHRLSLSRLVSDKSRDWDLGILGQRRRNRWPVFRGFGSG